MCYEEFTAADPAARADLIAAAKREMIAATGKKQMVSIRLAPDDVKAIKRSFRRFFITALRAIWSLSPRPRSCSRWSSDVWVAEVVGWKKGAKAPREDREHR